VDDDLGFFDRIHGTIHVSVPGQLWVRSDELNIELTANLDVGLRQRGDFFINGTVQARRGYAEFFGRHFDVSRALIEFQGGATNPRISAEAEYDASPRDIIVELRGFAKDLTPRLSSDPPGYSEQEAIGVLLTGSPDYQRQGGGTSAGGVATGYLVGELRQKLGATLPFDVLTADIVAEQERDPTARSRIEVGKYLTDRLFLKVGRTFASAEQGPINQVTLDYRLSDKWSLETTQTDAGRSDIGLQWTLNY
jgi:autotransporter translocation and assembly factor TamB